MSLEYIRTVYKVPANKGGRVRYTGAGEPQLGTITGANGAHVLIRLDGKKHAAPFHPTWELAYLAPEAST